MNTKKKILRTGKIQFATHGYEGTTMAMIAEAVGIKKPSLYAHYSNKEAIFKGVLESEFEEYITFVTDILEKENHSALEKLSALYMAHLPEAGEPDGSNDFYYRFTKFQPPGLEEYISRKYRESEEAQFEIFSGVVEDGKREGVIDPALSARQVYEAYFLLLDGIDSMQGLYDAEYIQKSGRNAWQVFYRGIRA